MTDAELFNAMSGLHAYDQGATDSGICDEILRQRVMSELKRDLSPGSIAGPRLNAFALNMLRDPEYGLSSVVEFVRWLSDYMEIDL